jgi:hypothetical protein
MLSFPNTRPLQSTKGETDSTPPAEIGFLRYFCCHNTEWIANKKRASSENA